MKSYIGKKPGKAIIIFAVLILSIVFQMISIDNVAAFDDIDENLGYLKSVIEMINDKYMGKITERELLEGALKGIFDSMDPYTSYFSLDEAYDLFSGIKGTYEGIGIGFEKDGDYTVVTKVFSYSPAEGSGIIPGDVIVSIDGENITGMSVENIQSLIMGERGTKIILGIMRSGNSNVLEIEVERAQIKISPVTYDIREDIGYIKLETFNSNTDEFLTEALNVIDDKKVDKIILDLRDNPGGEVSQAVAAARRFVPKGLVTKLDFKSENIEDEEYYSYLESPKYKLVVLVNGMSASASEILAGAIQDTNAGTLIGTKTFGKAKVQNMVPLLTPEAYKKYEIRFGTKIVDAYELISVYGLMPEDEDIIGWSKITTGVYITPKGRMIDGKGLTPDIIVADAYINDDIDIKSIQKLTLTSKPELNDVCYDVYSAEKILMLLGYEVDKPDMKLDAKTHKAIFKFQKDNKLYPYGVLDFATQRAFNEKLKHVIMQKDKQYAKAVEVLNIQ